MGDTFGNLALAAYATSIVVWAVWLYIYFVKGTRR